MLLNLPKSIPNGHSYQKIYNQHRMFNSIPKYGATSSGKWHGWLLILFTSEALFQSTLFEENYWGRSDFLHLLYHNHRDFIYICISNIKVNSLVGAKLIQSLIRLSVWSNSQKKKGISVIARIPSVQSNVGTRKRVFTVVL